MRHSQKFAYFAKTPYNTARLSGLVTEPLKTPNFPLKTQVHNWVGALEN